LSFINLTDNVLDIEDSDPSEKAIIEGFAPLFKKKGFDKRGLSLGVNSSPDFGHFELADRFWVGSLAIYFSGVSRCFSAKGGGYPEPWLFNACHSIECYLKGLLLYSVWFQEVHNKANSPNQGKYLMELKKYFRKSLHLYEIYDNYQNRLSEVIDQWKGKELPDRPELKKMLFTPDAEHILKEIDEVDKKSSRFGYPNLKRSEADQLPLSSRQADGLQVPHGPGLPKDPGYFFDHMVVINSLHSLRQEIKAIESYLGQFRDYIGGFQDIAKES
jgi:hypothetical protein